MFDDFDVGVNRFFDEFGKAARDVVKDVTAAMDSAVQPSPAQASPAKCPVCQATLIVEESRTEEPGRLLVTKALSCSNKHYSHISRTRMDR